MNFTWINKLNIHKLSHLWLPGRVKLTQKNSMEVIVAHVCVCVYVSVRVRVCMEVRGRPHASVTVFCVWGRAEQWDCSCSLLWASRGLWGLKLWSLPTKSSSQPRSEFFCASERSAPSPSSPSPHMLGYVGSPIWEVWARKAFDQFTAAKTQWLDSWES